MKNRSHLLFFSQKYGFVNSNKGGDGESQSEAPKIKPIEFSAPIDDTKDHELTWKFMRRFLILIPLSLILIYKAGFIRTNPFSRQKEYTFFSDKFEKTIVGPYITKGVMKELDGKIYKQDTEETKRGIDICDKIIAKNNLKPYLKNLKIHVVHIPVAGTFMSLDQTLFVSVKLLRLAKTDDELALIITHELGHYLLGHLPLKYMKMKYFMRRYNKEGPKMYIDSDNEIAKKKYNKYTGFYPEKYHFDKFYERRTDMMSHELILKADYDIFQAIEIYKNVQEFIGKPSPYAFRKSDPNHAYGHYEMAERLVKSANLEK